MVLSRFPKCVWTQRAVTIAFVWMDSLMQPPLLALLFISNDTATTEIYTLSLHALFRSRGVHCSCPHGYQPSQTDPLTCVDVNECSSGLDQCSQVRLDTGGSHDCFCLDGLTDATTIAGMTGKDCRAATCESLSLLVHDP